MKFHHDLNHNSISILRLFTRFCFLSVTLIAQTPIVTTISPLRNELNVSEQTSITITFSNDINDSTLTNETIKIHSSISGLHSHLSNYDIATKTVTINPITKFVQGEIVIVTATRGIKSVTGDSLTSAYSWQFTVKSNIGTGQFLQNSTPSVNSWPTSICASDFNGDGAIDFAVACMSSTTPLIFLNNGNTTFISNPTPSAGSTPYYLAAGDFNNDNTSDLLLVNQTSHSISILLNDGSGNFTPNSTTTVGNEPYSAAIADFNRDGFLDLAIANYSSNSVSILFNNGNGSFVLNSTRIVGSNPRSIITGDFNADGAFDLATANVSSGTVSILLNNGNGKFSQNSTPDAGNYPTCIVTGDFNADGALDIAAVNNTDLGTVTILLNNGSGSFVQGSKPTVGNIPLSLASGDFNGDGTIDLAVMNQVPNTVTMLMNNGTASFTKNADAVVGRDPFTLAAADFNGDGTLDLAVANSNNNPSSTISILLNRLPSASISVENISLYFGVGAVGKAASKNQFLKIYNEGTDSSLVISNITCSDTAFSLNKKSLVIPPLGVDSIQVKFSPTEARYYSDSIMITTNDLHNPIVFVNVTGIGNVIETVLPAVSEKLVSPTDTINVTFKLDININSMTDSTVRVLGSISGLHKCTFKYSSSTKTVMIIPKTVFRYGESVTVIITQGVTDLTGDSISNAFAWNFGIDVSPTAGYFSKSRITNTVNSPSSAVVGDLNADGKVDLAVLNGNTVFILFNNGNDVFTQSSTAVVGSSSRSITAGDFNGDGIIDLAVTNNGSHNVSILMNNGEGLFVESSRVIAGNAPSTIATGDINNDGWLDLIVSNESYSTATILFNNGRGIFSQTSTVSGEGDLGALTIGDFDRDGAIDLAIAEYFYNTISIFLNDGTGGFSKKSTLKAGVNPYSISTGDFNGDGTLDLTVGNYFSNTILIFENDGSAGFRQSSTVKIGGTPYSITAEDFNGDGMLDLVVPNSTSNTVLILLNNGNGDFTQTAISCGGIFPWFVSVGDFNGDTSLDLAILNINSNNITMSMNNAPAPPKNLMGITGDKQVILKWSKNTETNFLRYLIYQGLISGEETLIDSTVTGITDTIKIINGLTNNRKYYFYVTAMDIKRLESSASVEIKVTPNSPPSAPFNLVAFPGNAQVLLKWNKNIEPDFLRYRIYGGTTPNPVTKIDSTSKGINDTTIVKKGLFNDSLYYFSVTAVDSEGLESIYSNEVSATPWSGSVGVENEIKGSVPQIYTLLQNYPNPFNPSTKIRFGIPEKSFVRVIIYDVLGREITRLFEGILDASYQQIEWTPNMCSGLYICRIDAISLNDLKKKFFDVKKMILLQ